MQAVYPFFGHGSGEFVALIQGCLRWWGHEFRRVKFSAGSFIYFDNKECILVGMNARRGDSDNESFGVIFVFKELVNQTLISRTSPRGFVPLLKVMGELES